jgi:hypothetical protein
VVATRRWLDGAVTLASFEDVKAAPKGSETLRAGSAPVGIDETKSQQVIKHRSPMKAIHFAFTALRTLLAHGLLI